jgi:hypothetical protein
VERQRRGTRLILASLTGEASSIEFQSRQLLSFPKDALSSLIVVPGLISVLKSALVDSHSKGNTRRATLCYERTVHITKEDWDRGWGCRCVTTHTISWIPLDGPRSYRCFEMACTALMDQQLQLMYFPLLDSPTSPCVRNLQLWIEEAWKEGTSAIFVFTGYSKY